MNTTLENDYLSFFLLIKYSSKGEITLCKQSKIFDLAFRDKISLRHGKRKVKGNSNIA